MIRPARTFLVALTAVVVGISAFGPRAGASLSVTPGTRILGGAVAESDLTEAGEALASLRSEIDRLERDIRRAREDDRAEARALAAEDEELRLILTRERLRLADLENVVALRRSAALARGASDDDLARAVAVALDQAIRSVERRLPFRFDERRQLLTSLERDFERGLLDAETCASRLWQFVEDEIRLCRGIGRHRQAIAIGDERELVDVVRLGMVALYTRSQDGRYGQAVETDDGFRFEWFDDDARARATAELFRAADRAAAAGAFEIPVGRVVTAP